MKMSEEDVARIIADKLPLLCLDTCSILDTMRDPTREDASANALSATLFLSSKIQYGAELLGLIADQVSHELNDHLGPVEEEAKRAIGKLKKNIERIDEIAAVFGAAVKTNLSHLDNHVTAAKAAMQQIIGSAKSFDEPPDIAGRALVRVNQAKTPARQGKESMKDCVVIEAYLDVIGKLRARGWQGKAVFVSSNVNDYQGKTGTSLKPDLAAEFSAISLEYAPNMAAAKFRLGFPA